VKEAVSLPQLILQTKLLELHLQLESGGEKMPKQLMFIIFIAVIILAGFLAYTQVQMLR